MAQLTLATSILSVELGDGTRFETALQLFVEFFRAGGQLNDFRALLVILGRRGKTHRNEFCCFSLENTSPVVHGLAVSAWTNTDR